MCQSLIEIGSKTAEKNSAQTNRQTNRHYKNNGHLALNQFYGDRPRGTPQSGELNITGVAKHSNFGPIEGYISQMVQDRGGKLLLITNRKLYMSFQLVPKSVTLNDLEWHNDRYFALFQQIR